MNTPRPENLASTCPNAIVPRVRFRFTLFTFALAVSWGAVSPINAQQCSTSARAARAQQEDHSRLMAMIHEVPVLADGKSGSAASIDQSLRSRSLDPDYESTTVLSAGEEEMFLVPLHTVRGEASALVILDDPDGRIPLLLSVVASAPGAELLVLFENLDTGRFEILSRSALEARTQEKGVVSDCIWRLVADGVTDLCSWGAFITCAGSSIINAGTGLVQCAVQLLGDLACSAGQEAVRGVQDCIRNAGGNPTYPSITSLTPAQDASVGQSFSISCQASAGQGALKEIVVYFDNVAAGSCSYFTSSTATCTKSYSLSASYVSPTHHVMCVARNQADYSTSRRNQVSISSTPPPGGCASAAIGLGQTLNGNWAAGCSSTHRTGRYARFYTFSIPSTQTIRIDLTSSTDAYLYLLSGSGANGSIVEEDDDDGDGNNSRIVRSLSAGTYTIEATTYNSSATGSFSVSVTGSSASTGACYIDTTCSGSAGAQLVRSRATGSCVAPSTCTELWKCAAGAQGGSCGGGSVACDFSPGCSSDMQRCTDGICALSSTCEDRLRHGSYRTCP
jgi:hypothetical protein